jgi:hypothetical protein
MRPTQHRFQSIFSVTTEYPRHVSTHCDLFLRPPLLRDDLLSPFPFPYSLSPIPSHCAITVEPWKAPRNSSSHRVRPSRYRAHHPLRHRRVSGIQPLGPKIPRGIVPSARGDWNRAAASSFVPSAVITCPARTIISRRRFDPYPVFDYDSSLWDWPF